MKLISTLFVIQLFFISSSNAQPPLIINGDDNRHDIVSSSLFWQVISRSVAGKIRKSQVYKDESGQMWLEQHSLKESWNVCSDERFAEQPVGPHCTGFLVGPDLLATAGHCITSQWDCENSYWVFDFDFPQYRSHQGKELMPLSTTISCAELLISVRPGPDHEGWDEADWALIRLERELHRPALPLLPGNLKKGQSLIMMGLPLGLPLKVSDAAQVKRDELNHVVFADLDSFVGNSGSPVLSERGEVLGIVSGGMSDFEWDSQNKCNRMKVCEGNSCNHEIVQRIGPLAKFLSKKR